MPQAHPNPRKSRVESLGPGGRGDAAQRRDGIGYALDMTPEALQRLLDYHYWARDRLLDAVESLTPDQFRRDLGNSFGSVRDTLVHMVSAEWAWCSRWEGEHPSGHLEVTDFETVQAIRSRWATEEARVRRYVDRLGPDGINRVLGYAHFNGATLESVFWQMLQHVVNHATFPRGQVTTMLRQLGVRAPRSQDMIVFYRDVRP